MLSPEHNPYQPAERYPVTDTSEKSIAALVRIKFGIVIGSTFTSEFVESRLNPPLEKAWNDQTNYTLYLNRGLSRAQRIYQIVHAASHCAIGEQLNPTPTTVVELTPQQRKDSVATILTYNADTTDKHLSAFAITASLIHGLSGDTQEILKHHLADCTHEVWATTMYPSLNQLSTLLASQQIDPYRDDLLQKVHQESEALHR